MIVDLDELESGAVIDADLCIVGAGAAGIAIAREFEGSRFQVCLLESGGLDLEDDTQALYEGVNAGRPYYDLEECRLRFFGGTTNHWGRRCTPFDAIDFEKRSWVPYSGWPFSRAHLEPFYVRAKTLCGLGDLSYDDDVWKHLGYTPPALDPDRLKTGFWQFAHWQSFGQAFGEGLKKSSNIRVILHANLIEINTDNTGSSVRHMDIASLGGKTGRVRARTYILATGGIENARLLLSSNQVSTTGLGNQHDLVGRFFMDHHAGLCGIVQTAEPRDLIGQFERYNHHGTDYLGFFAPTSEAQKREQILNCSVLIDYIPDPESGALAAQKIWHHLKAGESVPDFGEKIGRVVSDLGDVSRSLYRRYAMGRYMMARPSVVYLRSEGEHAPNRESRVTLSRGRDQLGQNTAKLAWRLSKIDKRTVATTTKLIGTEFGRLGLARVQLAEWALDDTGSWPEDFEPSYHHMGTTRMSDSPSEGVVDRNSKVHGMNNLYVAGSSVFPTYGHANPTLTIVALALRLADYLKK